MLCFDHFWPLAHLSPDLHRRSVHKERPQLLSVFSTGWLQMLIVVRSLFDRHC